ncbi:MAG: site-2 protease family protein [Bacteroidota bacterium]
MKGVFRIVTISGIPLQVHWSFGLLLFYVLYMGKSLNLDWKGIALFALLVLALFTCVVMHEFGHALAARRYGVQTKDIILSPIGGVARLNRLPDKPFQEFVIAIAGPLVNVAIALVLGLGLWLFSEQGLWPEGTERTLLGDRSNFIPMLFVMNIALVAFNMLPAFPMDGGRIFRSLLSIPLGRVKATRVAALLGKSLAVLFVLWSIYSSDLVVGLIGVFVFITATQEYRMVRFDGLLASHTVADIMRSQYTRISQSEPMTRPIHMLQHSMEKNFLVFDEMEQLRGVLHEAFIMEALKNGEREAPVAEFLSTSYENLSMDDPLNKVLRLMQENAYSILPVQKENMLIGVVDVSMLNNFIRLQQQLN